MNKNEINTVYSLIAIFLINAIIFFVLFVLNNKQKQEKSEPTEPPTIVCSYCKGSGQVVTDVNKLMVDARLAIFANKHLMTDKCEECVKLPDSKSYEYCDKVNDYYHTLLKDYAVTGPKMQKALCQKCMGMGTFSMKDMITNKWMTQEEWDQMKSNMEKKNYERN